MKTLKKMLKLCTDIYDEPGRGHVIENDTDYCEIIQDGSDVYVVFRGTDNKLGWRSNFRCSDLNENNVHDGFEMAFNNLVNNLVLDFSNVKHIYCTGHSRGGVMAIQIAYDLLFGRRKVPISCITFGAPRLGGKYWRGKLNRSKVYLTRVEVPGDPVCDVPLRAMGYRKEGNILKLKTPWYWNLGTLPIIRAWKHSPKAYLKAIEYTERKQRQ
jgi:hypothetical protein